MTNPLVSVIIPLWNGADYIEQAIQALLAQSYTRFEILVIDNGSTDGGGDRVSARFAAQEFPQLSVWSQPQNLGFSGGCNVGAAQARGEVLIFLNQDTVVDPQWMKALLAALADPTVGVAGCKIRYPDGRLQHAGGVIQWPTGQTAHLGQHESDDGRWDQAGPVDFVTGAAMALRRAVWDQVGSFDEGFFPGYYEDTDYCLRVRAAGYQIWYEPKASLIHQESTTISDRDLAWRFYHRGRLRFVFKHLPPQQLAEFAAAELAQWPQILQTIGRQPLSRAYLDTLIAADLILPPGLMERLHRGLWVESSALRADQIKSRVEAEIHAQAHAPMPTAGLVTDLAEYQFEGHQSSPAASLRRRIWLWWYRFILEAPLENLRTQQSQINRQMATGYAAQFADLAAELVRDRAIFQRTLDAHAEQMGDLAAENTALAQQIRQIRAAQQPKQNPSIPSSPDPVHETNL